MKKPKKPTKASVTLDIDTGKALYFDVPKLKDIPVMVKKEAHAATKNDNDAELFDFLRWDKSLTKKEKATFKKLLADVEKTAKAYGEEEKKVANTRETDELDETKPPSKAEIAYSRAEDIFTNWQDTHGLHTCINCRYYMQPSAEGSSGVCMKLKKATRPVSNSCPKYTTSTFEEDWEILDMNTADPAIERWSSSCNWHGNSDEERDND